MSSESSHSPHRDVLAAFSIDGELESLVEHKVGHINSTFIATWKGPNGPVRYVHQLINSEIFRDVPGMMRNIEKVTTEIRRNTGHHGRFTSPSIVPTRDGQLFVLDEQGAYWRTLEYVEGTCGFETCPDSAIAREAGRALGLFHRLVADIDPKGLVDTIPRFHDGGLRLQQLESAVSEDRLTRARQCQREIDFARERSDLASLLMKALAAGRSTVRTTHNDVKLNNILFSDVDRTACCLVDLDTCMPGSILFDFGDLARNATVTADEDETDRSKISVDTGRFAELLSGYGAAVGAGILESEIDLICAAPRVLALTLGARFLADHINGDTYFKVRRQGHNLDRARAQFAVVEEFEKVESDLRAAVGRVFQTG